MIFFSFYFLFLFLFSYSHDYVSVPRDTLGQGTSSMETGVYKGRGRSVSSLALRLFLSSIDAILVSSFFEPLVFGVLVVVSG